MERNDDNINEKPKGNMIQNENREDEALPTDNESTNNGERNQESGIDSKSTSRESNSPQSTGGGV